MFRKFIHIVRLSASTGRGSFDLRGDADITSQHQLVPMARNREEEIGAGYHGEVRTAKKRFCPRHPNDLEFRYMTEALSSSGLTRSVSVGNDRSFSFMGLYAER
jgi:hypothetical protein